jgi:hypothetical protein
VAFAQDFTSNQSESALTDSIKLIRCQVKNLENNDSIRYIELENYKLWEQVMLHKHRFQIKHRSLGLWIDHTTFKSKEVFFSYIGEIDEVTKLSLSIHDLKYGYCYRNNRFVLTKDLKFAREAIVNHISEEIRSSGDYEVEETLGHCIIKEENLDNATLGLIRG